MPNCKCTFLTSALLFAAAAMIPATASPAYSDVSILSVQDSMSPSGTKEYVLTVPNPGELTITLTGWQGTYNWSADYDRLYVHNAAGEAIDRNSQSSASDPFIGHMMGNPATITTRVGAAGSYTLRLHSGQAAGWPEGKTTQNYTLSVTLTPADDIHEVNDSMDAATTVTPGQTVTAYQWRRTNRADVYGDQDWYRIELPSPGTLNIDLTNWVSTYNWSLDYDRLYIYRADGRMFNSSNAEEPLSWMMGSDGSASVAVGYGGTYYVRLHAGAGTSTTPYTVTFSFMPSNDVHEPNDDIASSTSISIGEMVTAYQWRSLEQGPSIAGDEDWYRIEIPSPGIARIEVNGWKSLYNWSTDVDYLWLYDADGQLFGPNGTTDSFAHMMGSNHVVEAKLSHGGTYYLRFHSGSASNTTPYTIQVDFEGAADVFEPNDTFAQAKGLESGVDYTAYQWKSLAQGSFYVGDEDYYSFTVTETCDLGIAVTGWVSTYNWSADYDRIYLYRGVADADTTRYDKLMETHMIGSGYTHTRRVEPGRYFLRLHSGWGWSKDPYTIRLTYIGAGETGVASVEPIDFAVSDPWPNPFNPSTTLDLRLPESRTVSVAVFSMTGQKIATLADGVFPAGYHAVVWNGTDSSGMPMAAGMYFIHVRAGAYSGAKKVLLLK